MRTLLKNITISNVTHKVELLEIEESDRAYLRDLYNMWISLTRGMKKFQSRGINLPEGISESAFCLEMNAYRVLDVVGSSTSFDTLCKSTSRRQQIKACSVQKELTSFGPDSVWDDLYFLDFYRVGKYDGTFDVYKIPNNLVYNLKINATQTFRDQQRQKRRPRFSVKNLILAPNKLKPIKTCKI